MSIQPKNKVFFCSAASRYAQEMLAGTASNYQSFVLVEYSEPFPAKVNYCKLDSDWIASMQKFAQQKKGKLVLIRNKNSVKSFIRIIFVDCLKRRYCNVFTTEKDYTNIHLSQLLNDEKIIWETKPFVIVCTNGKKDKCCSKFGFPVYKFMEGMLADTDVWECTHIGGDRFAANLIYLPFGIYYGRVTIEDVPEMVDAFEQEKIYIQNYRGLSKLSFLFQSVEYYLRKHLNDFRIDFPMKILERTNNENEIIFKVQIRQNCFTISVTKQVMLYPHLLTCTSKKRENVVKYLLNFIQEKEITP